IARARWVSRESIVAILTHPGIGSGTTVLLAWAGPRRNHGCRDAHGEHQEPDQTEPPERAAAPAQQDHAFRAQDPGQAGGRGPRDRRRRRRRSGPRRAEAAGQGGREGRRAQEPGRPAHVPPDEAGRERIALSASAAATAPGAETLAGSARPAPGPTGRPAARRAPRGPRPPGSRARP